MPALLPRDNFHELFHTFVLYLGRNANIVPRTAQSSPTNIPLEASSRLHRASCLPFCSPGTHVLARTRFVTPCGVSLPVVEDKNPPDVRRYGRS